MEKVAIINSVYEYGSTGSLTRDLYRYGKKVGYDTFAFYGRGSEYDDKQIIKIDSKLEFYTHKLLTLISGLQGYYSKKATEKLLNILKKEKISKVILLNIHGYYLNEPMLWKYLKEYNIRTVYITPDEYAGLGKCAYNNGCEKYKTECCDCPQIHEYPKSLFFDQSKKIFEMKRDSYYGYKNLILLGPETNLNKFKKSALTKDLPMKKIDWGIDTDLYKFAPDDSTYIKYGIPKDKIIILTAASYKSPRKGVKKYFFGAARSLENTKYHFINIGYDGELSETEMPKNMTVIPYVNDQKELAKIYSVCDVYALASTGDTQPLSCLIALACGIPVVCFNTSGLKYLGPHDNRIIYFVNEISEAAFTNAISSIQKKDKSLMDECRKYALNRYSIETFNKSVYDALEQRL